jgi:hypothetical protein
MNGNQNLRRRLLISSQDRRCRKFFEPYFLLPNFFQTGKKVRKYFWALTRMVRSAVQKNSQNLRLLRCSLPFKALFSFFTRDRPERSGAKKFWAQTFLPQKNSGVVGESGIFVFVS